VARARQPNRSRKHPPGKVRRKRPISGARREIARKAALARWTREKMQPPAGGSGAAVPVVRPNNGRDTRAALRQLYQPTAAIAATVVRRIKADEDGGRLPVGTLGRKWQAFIGAQVTDGDDQQALTRGARLVSRMGIWEDVRKARLVIRSVLRSTRDPRSQIRRVESRLKRVLRDWDRRLGKGPQSHTSTITKAMYPNGTKNGIAGAPKEMAVEVIATKYGLGAGTTVNYAKEGGHFRKKPF
jgi:hypothetical protein